MRPKVFIAYAHENAAEAKRLAQTLENNGFEPWIDCANLAGGSRWITAIRRAIKSSDFFVACLSTTAVNKIGFFQRELREAFAILQEYPDENIYLIPVRLDDCVAPFDLQDQQWVDLFVPGGEQKLVRAIRDEWAARRARDGPATPFSAAPAGAQLADADRDGMLLNELQRAIENDELVLYYQPKVRLSTQHVVGVESLVRWNHPRRGLLFPESFIDVAESSNLIDALTVWVLNHALEQCAIWDHAGLEVPVGVNVSARNFKRATLPKIVERALCHWKVPPSRLQIEVTETAVADDIVEARAVLAELRRIGVSVAIDDFGTGHASINMLNRLSFDELKLDRPIVDKIEDSDQQQSIVKALVQMGHNLGLRVIAEGVESVATYGVLFALDCDDVQGYFLSKPLPPREFVRWLVDSPWKLDWGATPAAGQAPKTRSNRRLTSSPPQLRAAG